MKDSLRKLPGEDFRWARLFNTTDVDTHGATTNPPSWLKYLNGSPRKLHGGDFLWTRLFNKTEVDTHGTTAVEPPRQRDNILST